MRHFTVIAEPLLDLLKKDLLFIWTNTHAKAFTVLKQALCSARVLALPDFSVPFHIERQMPLGLVWALSFNRMAIRLHS